MDTPRLPKSLETMSSKIGSLVCFATEILAPHEPLRVHLRNEVVKLLANSVTCESGESLSVIQNVQCLRDSIGQLMAGSGLLRDSHIINQTTYEVLKSDLEILRGELGNCLSRASVLSTGADFVETSNPETWEQGVKRDKSLQNPIIRASTHGNSDRRSKILELLGKFGPSSVSDLALHIEGCSDKTIQRELVSMVSTGLLKKTGERRWSRYSLLL